MNQKKVVRLIKKIAQDVDNSSNYSEKRYKMICQIQQLLKEGCSYREIARRMGVGRDTIAKYRTGDPRELRFPCSTSQLKPHFAIRKPRSNPTGIEKNVKKMPSLKISCFICFFVAPRALIFPYSCILLTIPT